jgi:hypothetical protein
MGELMMKKKLITWSFILVFTIIGVTGFDYLNNQPTDIALEGSNEVFNYTDLVNEANVVALVKVKDKLSKDNSTVVYQENTSIIKYHYATREAEVLKYYKNDLDLGSNIKFNEAVAITSNNEYLHDEEYAALEKGKEYIVYLSTNNGLGELSLISNNNGKIKLDDFLNNEYKDIAIKSVLKIDNGNFFGNTIFNYDVPEQKKVTKGIEKAKVKKIDEQDVELPDIYYYFDEKNNVEYLNVGGIDFSVQGKLYSK